MKIKWSKVTTDHTIKVYVASSIYEKTTPDNYKVWHWVTGQVGQDVSCTSTDNTVQKTISEASPNEQTYYEFTAVIPEASTNYKFHIGNTWYGENGTVQTPSVYIHENNGNKMAYYEQ